MLARSGNGPIIFTVGGGEVGKKTIEIGLLFNVQNICTYLHGHTLMFMCFFYMFFCLKMRRKTRRYKSCDHANKCKWFLFSVSTSNECKQRIRSMWSSRVVAWHRFSLCHRHQPERLHNPCSSSQQFFLSFALPPLPFCSTFCFLYPVLAQQKE